MNLKIAWIKFKSIVHLPIYRKDVLIWAKYYYANEDYDGLCCAIEDSVRDLMYVYNVPQHFIPLLNPDIVKSFHKRYCVDTSNINYRFKSYWWEPYTWKLNGGRLGFLNWMIEQYKDDKTNLKTYESTH